MLKLQSLPRMGRMMRQPIAVLVSLLLSGCAVQDAQIAARGHSELIGLRQSDLLMCAGHPANVDKAKGSEIWMYEHGVATTSVTVTPTVPLVGASIAPPSGYCRVQLRLVHQQVVDVSYAGATDFLGEQDAVCAPIVRSCVERKQAATRTRTD